MTKREGGLLKIDPTKIGLKEADLDNAKFEIPEERPQKNKATPKKEKTVKAPSGAGLWPSFQPDQFWEEFDKPKAKSITIGLSQDLMDRIDNNLQNLRGISKNKWILQALLKALDADEKGS